MDRLSNLQHILESIPQSQYPSASRIHLLRTFNFPNLQCYVKRDDELGFGISGSKIRKYRTLIPFLINRGIEEVVMIGSLYSNHIISFLQLLIENGIHPTLFLRGDPDRLPIGNGLLTTISANKSSIHWFSKNKWQNVETAAKKYAAEKNYPIFILPEGGFCSAALPGALTLPLDILENEKQLGFQFNHIFVDAGTGFMAISLILGLGWMKHPAMVHVLLLAEDQEAFMHRLNICREMFFELVSSPNPFSLNFSLHIPQVTGNFGNVSSHVFKKISHLLRNEGFLTDPIYSAKLFIETESLLLHGNYQGKILIHHSGGALTLMGFQEQLQHLID